jgi:hypothetical protein
MDRVEAARTFGLKAHWVLLAVVAVVGLAVVRQYGESWDERQFFKYADRALQSYATWLPDGQVQLTGNTYDNYGPAYVMLVTLATRLLGLALPWIRSDIRHLAYFATFMAGLWAFHKLCSRWLGRTAAIAALLLFVTQPLIWGHAFISPKDLPFLAFFLLTVEVGLEMVEHTRLTALSELSSISRRRLLLLTCAWAILVFGILESTPLVHSYVVRLVDSAAAGESNLAAWVASDIRTASPAIYIRKFFVAYLQARAVLVAGSAAALALLWRRAPSAFRLALSAAPGAILLGFTTSIRLLAPLAALIVAVYAFWKLGRKAIVLLIIYILLAGAAMYATWPYLWPNPVGHLAESAAVMAKYPWQGSVLFEGSMYPSTGLPRSYLPVLLGIQLTEPVWFLFAAGLLIAAFQAGKGNQRALGLVGLAAAWFILPMGFFVMNRTALYDNFRQVLFILPPVFIVAGATLDRIRPVPFRVAFLGLIILPGVLASIHLHPYEYIYYNRFAGGESGAFRQFEMDYWGTSYREAAQYLNHTASANTNVWAEGPAHLLQVYIRPDIKVYSTYEVERADHYDFVVALTRYNLDETSYPGAPITHVIERGGALLTVIKSPQR